LPGEQIRNLRFSNIVINGSNWGITTNVDSAHSLEEIKTRYPNTPRNTDVGGPVAPKGIRNVM